MPGQLRAARQRGERECHDCRMDSPAAAAVPTPVQAGSRWRTSRKFCVSLAVVWSLLGASMCAVLFAVSLVPETGSYPDYARSVPRGLVVAATVFEVGMLPRAVIPVPLLIAGRKCLRRSRAGTRRVAAWTAVASGGIVVEAVFWFRLFHFMNSGRWLYPRSWHVLELSAGFLIAGVAMAGVLLGIASPASRPTPSDR